MFPALDTADLPADAVEVGRIAEAWGIKGWFKVIPHSADPQALFSSRQWHVLPPEQGPRSFEGTHRLRIREARDHAGGVVASAHGVDTREDAAELRGARVFVGRSSFPSTLADEFYWVDLIGLEVVNREGVSLGHVRDLLSSAAQAVLVLEQPGDGKQPGRMIPFVAAYVDAVDLPGKRITVDWQPDY